MTVENARHAEELYFRDHEEFGPYMHSRPELFGVASLTHTLSEILVGRIEENLPQMVAEVNALIRETRESLEKLGHSIPDTDEGKFLYPMHVCVCIIYTHTRMCVYNIHTYTYTSLENLSI
jgi:hypothetical protein